jgi:hypothetical protein
MENMHFLNCCENFENSARSTVTSNNENSDENFVYEIEDLTYSLPSDTNCILLEG